MDEKEREDIETSLGYLQSTNAGFSYFEIFRNTRDVQLLAKQITEWRKRYKQLNHRGIAFVNYCDFPEKRRKPDENLSTIRTMTMPSNFLSCATPSSRSLSRLSSAGNYTRLSRVTTPAMFFNRLKKPQGETSIELYRMQPLRPFKTKEVQQIIKDVLESLFDEKSVYQEETARRLTKVASNTIKEKVKSLHYSRYRIISFVYCGQNQRQGLAIASMTLIDKENDRFTDYTVNRKGYFVTAIVYGIHKH